MYENIEDALRDAVRALGGTKAVGGKLFPSLPIEQAASRVADCLNIDRRHQRLIPCHRCHNCEASLPAGFLFCDTDCRDDYQRRAKRHP